MNLEILYTILLYAIVEFLAVFFMHRAKKAQKKRRHITIKTKFLSIKLPERILYLILSFLPLIILIIFKNDSVGMDTQRYQSAYNAIRDKTLNPQLEAWLGIGFKSLATFFAFLQMDYHIFFACISLITLLLFYQVIWKYSKNPALSIFIFISTCLYFQTFNQYRQMLAIAIVFFSYNFITPKKSLLKFILTIIIAASFHNSALIFLPMYFISKIRINKITIFAYLLIAIVAHLAYEPLLLLLSNTHYGKMYIGSYLDLSFKLSTILNMIIRAILLISCLISYKKMTKADKASQGMYHMIIICTIIQTFAIRSYTFARLTTYFFTFYIVLIPNIIFFIYKNNIKLLYCIVAFFICYQLFYYSSSSAVESGYQVYHFYLDKENIKE